jgi:hypothetical protein
MTQTVNHDAAPLTKCPATAGRWQAILDHRVKEAGPNVLGIPREQTLNHPVDSDSVVLRSAKIPILAKLCRNGPAFSSSGQIDI